MKESPRTVIAAIAANLGIALAKFTAGFFSGSAAMLAEAIHSSVALRSPIAHHQRRLELRGARLESDEHIAEVLRVLTAQLAPDNVLLNLDVRFASCANDGDLPRSIDRIESAIHERYPQIKEVFIEAQAVSERSSRR